MEEPESLPEPPLGQEDAAKDALASSDATPTTDNSTENDITVIAERAPEHRVENIHVAGQPCAPEAAGNDGEAVCSHMEVLGAAGGVSEDGRCPEAAETGDVTASGALTTSPRAAAQPIQAYHVKWVTWQNQNTPIITQNENGPCPLIAIVNVLLLRETIQIPQMVEMVSASQLFEYLGDHLLSRMPKNASEDIQKNYEQNMHDAMEIMSHLQTGLDVNVKFTGVRDFEYTQECVVFDLLNIALYHGWLYDPQNLEVVSAVNTCSYNQLVERIIATKTSSDEEQVRQGLLAEQFLASNASQLTYHGLCELISTIGEEELCVFFRNNHFSTLYKHNNELYVLVTDQGFLTESNVVWETLSNVEGDSYFVDGNFRRRAVSSGPLTPPPPMSTDQQIDTDLLLALSLQESASQGEGTPPNQQQEKGVPAEPTLSEGVMTDHQLALQLQQQEDFRIAQQLSQNEQEQQEQQEQVGGGRGFQQAGPRQRQGQPSPQQPAAAGGGGSRRREERSCTIL